MNNINSLSGGYCNFPSGPRATFSLYFQCNSDLGTKLIICFKKKNTSYLIDFLAPKPRYQKIGDFDKGEKLAFELMFYFDSHKYVNSLNKEFVELKNKHITKMVLVILKNMKNFG